MTESSKIDFFESLKLLKGRYLLVNKDNYSTLNHLTLRII